MSERLYHEIMCPSLTKTGPCTCQPVIVADAETHPVADSAVDCEEPPAVAAVDPSAASTGTPSTRE